MLAVLLEIMLYVAFGLLLAAAMALLTLDWKINNLKPWKPMSETQAYAARRAVSTQKKAALLGVVSLVLFVTSLILQKFV